MASNVNIEANGVRYNVKIPNFIKHILLLKYVTLIIKPIRLAVIDIISKAAIIVE